jgi:type III restriction enzyme
VRLKTEPPIHLILEVKGYDELQEVKAQAARKWVAAINADRTYGRWACGLAKKPAEVKKLIFDAACPVDAAIEPQ